MQFVYKLRNAEQKYKGVITANDLTLAEREETKAMVAQAKIEEEQQSTPGEFKFRVRGRPGELTIVEDKGKTINKGNLTTSPQFNSIRLLAVIIF